MAEPSDQVRNRQGGLIFAVAGMLSLVWLLGVWLVWMLLPAREAPAGALGAVAWVILLLAPVVAIWVVAALARALADMRAEVRRLRASLDGLRSGLHAGATQGAMPADLEKTLKDLAKSARQTEAALARSVAVRAASTPAARQVTAPAARGAVARPVDDQPSLALGTPAEEIQAPLDVGDLVRALNFPDDAQDTEGFAALRRALRYREPAQLIQASQDMLTLMSQDGVYMDDLRPDTAQPDLWRRFAGGERGSALAALGGVRDRTSVALTTGRMREDAIFRDAAHHFLRKFDLVLEKYATEASDAQLMALADTRTARAFMLLGQVAGVFD